MCFRLCGRNDDAAAQGADLKSFEMGMAGSIGRLNSRMRELNGLTEM